jgi:hypothetical protein
LGLFVGENEKSLFRTVTSEFLHNKLR